MALAVAVPLCGWFLAACVSSTFGISVNSTLTDTGPQDHANSLRRRSARSARSSRIQKAGCTNRIRLISNSRFNHRSGRANALSGASGLGTVPFGSARGGTLGSGGRTGPSLGVLGSGGSGEFLGSVGNGVLGSGMQWELRLGSVVRPGMRIMRRPVKCTINNELGKTHAVATSSSPAGHTDTTVPAVKSRRVVVTGMGVASCLGHDPKTFYDNLLAGNSGVTPIEGFDVSEFPTRIAGEIKSFDYTGYVHPKLAKRMDKFMWYLLTAGKKSLEDAGMTAEVRNGFDLQRCGILIGSAMGGMQVFHDAIEALNVSYRRMNPFCIPFVTTNMGSALLAMDLGWMGPNYSISTACATGNYCILSAANHIQRGEADVMLAGGSDAAILPIGLGGFVACRALSKRNNEPEKASRPWDKNRDGFVMGEGAAVLVLEELEHAKARGAEIYAEFLGGSFTCDAYHMTEPHPEGDGVHLCVEKALQQSGVNREDVNYVNAHATSTPAGDLQEYKALMRSFGRNKELKMNATKSMIGHLLGAAGAVEAVATVQAIRTGYLHPNLNLQDPDQGVDTSILVGPTMEKMKINVALSNSFGFGGHNSSILFAPYEE